MKTRIYFSSVLFNAIHTFQMTELRVGLDPPISPFFLPNKELPFSSVGEPLHDHGHIFACRPPPFNGPFFMTPPMTRVSKRCDRPSVSNPLCPLLISDKSLITGYSTVL